MISLPRIVVAAPLLAAVAAAAVARHCNAQSEAATAPKSDARAKSDDKPKSDDEPVTDDKPDFDAMIDALASRNEAPTFIHLKPTYSPKSVSLFLRQPLFPKDYDWDDQTRVVRALNRLFECDDPELWEHLLKYVDDKRYCITRGQPPSSSRNYTVGEICRKLVWSRLEFAERHTKSAVGDRANVVYVDVGISDLQKWRKENPDKSLYDLQVEFCERALKAIPTEEKLSEEARGRAEKKVRGYLDQLLETKKPLFFGSGIPGRGYTEKWAGLLREQYERQQTDEEGKPDGQKKKDGN